MALPERERARLARDLVASLEGPPDPDAAEAWEAEIRRRVREAGSGKAKLFDVYEVLAKVRPYHQL